VNSLINENIVNIAANKGKIPLLKNPFTGKYNGNIHRFNTERKYN